MMRYTSCLLLMFLLLTSCGDDDTLSYPATFVTSDFELLADRRVSVVTADGHRPTSSPVFDAAFAAIEQEDFAVDNLTGFAIESIVINDESTATITTVAGEERNDPTLNYTRDGDDFVFSGAMGEEIRFRLVDGGFELCWAFHNSVDVTEIPGTSEVQTFYDSSVDFCDVNSINRDAVMDSLATLYQPGDTIAFFQVVQRYEEE